MPDMKSDLMYVMEVAVNTCSEWRQQCEACTHLESCINSWTGKSNGLDDETLTVKELEQYVKKFCQFMDARMKECQGFDNN